MSPDGDLADEAEELVLDAGAVLLCGQCLKREFVSSMFRRTLGEKTALPPACWWQAYQHDSKVAPTAAPASSQGRACARRIAKDNPSTHAWQKVFRIQAPCSGSIRLLAPKAPRVRGSSRTPDATIRQKKEKAGDPGPCLGFYRLARERGRLQ